MKGGGLSTGVAVIIGSRKFDSQVRRSLWEESRASLRACLLRIGCCGITRHGSLPNLGFGDCSRLLCFGPSITDASKVSLFIAEFAYGLFGSASVISVFTAAAETEVIGCRIGPSGLLSSHALKGTAPLLRRGRRLVAACWLALVLLRGLR